MNWIPVNKATNQEYPPVDDAQKRRMETNYMTKGKYNFKPVKESAAPKTVKAKEAIQAEQKAPEPIEAKKVAPETGEQ